MTKTIFTQSIVGAPQRILSGSLLKYPRILKDVEARFTLVTMTKIRNNFHNQGCKSRQTTV